MENIVNLELNISKRAFAVAHLVNTHKNHLVLGKNQTLQTTAFYNGRERAIALTLFNWSAESKHKVIVFGECRNSDSIFVDTFSIESYIDLPTVKEFTKEAYDRRKTFNLIEDAANHIIYLLNAFVK